MCSSICYPTLLSCLVQEAKPASHRFVASCCLWQPCSVLSGSRQSAQQAEEEARQQHDALQTARVACREEEEQLHRWASAPPSHTVSEWSIHASTCNVCHDAATICLKPGAVKKFIYNAVQAMQ